MQRATYEKINRAVIFDRDGVINKLIPTSYGWTSPKNIDEFEWKPNIFDAVSMLRKYNFKIFVITNQPSITDEEAYEELKHYISSNLGLDDYITARNKESDWYKPGDGAFKYLEQTYHLDLKNSYMIGDRWQDIVPAYHNVMTTFLVKTPENPWKLPNLYNGYVQPTYIVESAFEACRKITDLEYEAMNEF